MARVPLNAVQKKIFTKLSTDAAGWATSAAIYDEVEENAAFPYVELGLFTDTHEPTKTTLFSDNTQTVTIWSEARGSLEMNAIVNQVVASLTDGTVEGAIDDNFRIFDVRLEMTEVFKRYEQGNTLRQGEVRVRFRVEDTLTA
jgi:hypothetical protein